MPWANGPESSMLCLEEVRRVAEPVESQTTTVFDQVHQNAALGTKSVVHICLFRLAYLQCESLLF